MRVLLPILVAASLLVSACNGNRDQLLADLQSTRPEQRAAAVKQLAAIGRAEDLVLFSRAAKDTAPIVRAEAASALGKSQDPRVVDLLGDLLGDADEMVQARAAMALAEIKSDKAKGYLTIQYSRRGRATRQAIVDALKSANVPGAMASVVAAESLTIWERSLRTLEDGSLAERVAAAEELGKSGRVEAVNRLLPLIKNSQVILAAAAVRGLGHAGDPRAVEPIAELLSENFPDLREAAVEALTRLRDPKALPRLRDVALERSATSSLACAAIISLPRTPEANAALCQIALGGAEDDALQAARAMRERGGCPLEPILERLARRQEPLAALHALEGLGPTAKEAAPKVIPLISSSDPALRMQAIRAAAALNDPGAVDAVKKVYQEALKDVERLRADWVHGPLPESFAAGYDPAAEAADGEREGDRLRQEDLFQKIRAANQLKLKASGKSAVLQTPPPHELVDDVSEDDLRLLAVSLQALGELGAPGAHALLSPWIQDPSPLVRIAAGSGLARLGTDGIAAAKVALLDSVREVQSAVALRLAERGEPGQAVIAEVIPRLAADRLPLLLALDRAGPVPVVAPALLGVLSEGGAEAALAAQLLGRLRSAAAVDPLMRSLEDPTSVARRDTLIALGHIGEVKAAALVARDLNHDSPEVRAAAAEALALLGTSPRPDALDALKGDYFRRVRETAEHALEKVGSGAEVARPQE